MQVVLGRFGVLGELLGVFQAGANIVDGAGTNDHEQSVIFLLDDLFGCFAAIGYGLGCTKGERVFFDENLGWDQGLDRLDASIVELVESVFVGEGRHVPSYPLLLLVVEKEREGVGGSLGRTNDAGPCTVGNKSQNSFESRTASSSRLIESFL